MGAYYGKTGTVVWDASAGDETIDTVTNWSIAATCDVADAADMSQTYHVFYAGFKDWTAIVETNLPTTGLEVPITAGVDEALGEHTPAKLELWTDDVSTEVLYGSAICTDITVAVSFDAVVKATYTFQGTGTLAWSTTEPSYA